MVLFSSNIYLVFRQTRTTIRLLGASAGFFLSRDSYLSSVSNYVGQIIWTFASTFTDLKYRQLITIRLRATKHQHIGCIDADICDQGAIFHHLRCFVFYQNETQNTHRNPRICVKAGHQTLKNSHGIAKFAVSSYFARTHCFFTLLAFGITRPAARGTYS